MKILWKMCLMRSEKSKKILEFLSQLRQFDTGLKQRLFVQKVKKHTCKSKHKSTVAFPEQYSFTTFKHGKKRLNDTIVLRWSAFDIWVSWWILLVQKEKICTFCLWSETSKSPWIFKPCNVWNYKHIERLWKFLRKEILANQYYHSFRDFYSAIESFVKTLHENYFEQLSSLLTFRFEVFDFSDFYWFLE